MLIDTSFRNRQIFVGSVSFHLDITPVDQLIVASVFAVNRCFLSRVSHQAGVLPQQQRLRRLLTQPNQLVQIGFHRD